MTVSQSGPNQQRQEDTGAGRRGVGRFARWLNFWRLRYTSDGPVTVEWYRSRGIVYVTRVWGK